MSCQAAAQGVETTSRRRLFSLVSQNPLFCGAFLQRKGISVAIAVSVSESFLCWQVVRAILWPDAWAQYYVTGGDDGVIALWYGSIPEAAPIPEEPNGDPRSTKRQRLSENVDPRV